MWFTTNFRREKAKIFGSLAPLARNHLKKSSSSSFQIGITRHEKGYISVTDTRTVVLTNMWFTNKLLKIKRMFKTQKCEKNSARSLCSLAILYIDVFKFLVFWSVKSVIKKAISWVLRKQGHVSTYELYQQTTSEKNRMFSMQKFENFGSLAETTIM